MDSFRILVKIYVHVTQNSKAYLGLLTDPIWQKGIVYSKHEYVHL